MSLRGRRRGCARRSGVFEVLEERVLLSATLLDDIAPGTLSSSPGEFATAGGKAYFEATAYVASGLGGQLMASPTQLWRTDGTPGGTALVFDAATAGALTLENLTGVGNRLFFTTRDASDNNILWVSNGTAGGTSTVVSLGGGVSSVTLSDFASFAGDVFFVETTSLGSALVWKSDGTARGTQVILNLSGAGTPATIGGFDVLGGNLLFASTGGTGAALWRSDGTTAGTAGIYGGAVTASTLVTAGGLAYFESVDAVGNSRLFRTNGTAAGTFLLSNFGISTMTAPAAENGRVFFGDGNSVWMASGNTVTLLAANVVASDFVAASGAINNGLVFFDARTTAGANIGVNDLWETNGTTGGTGAISATPIATGAVSDGFTLFYLALGTNSNVALWASDGSSAGTVDLQDFGATANPFAAQEMVLAGSTPVFAGTDATHGNEPWAFTRGDSSLTLASTAHTFVFPGNTSITLTATSTAADGAAVTFYDSGGAIGTTTVSGGVATLTVTSPAAGAHVYAAAYGGNTETNPAMSNSLSFQVAGTLNPIGFVDHTNTNVIQGWAFDPKLGTAAATVRITIDGVTYAQFAASAARGDLTAALGDPDHGFSYGLPNLAAGTHTVRAYVLDSATGAATLIGGDTVSIASPFFDEHYYLTRYPDVAAAVASGEFTSGYQHFLLYGQHEGRNPSPFFDQAYYLATNPDVAAAVRAGQIASGFAHFVAYGQFEARNPSPYFSESYYLLKNPDVAAAVAEGEFTSGFEHFVEYGQAEGRSPSAYFETAYYSGQFPAAGAAVAAGQYRSVFDYFMEVGNALGESPLDLFNTTYYLTTYPDVATAVAAHEFVSGFDHFMRYGRLEGRRPSTLYDEAAYLARYPDVRAAVAAGEFDCGLTHYLIYGRAEGRIAT